MSSLEDGRSAKNGANASPFGYSANHCLDPEAEIAAKTLNHRFELTSAAGIG